MKARTNIIFRKYTGAEADTILAQAEGYRRIVWEVLRGAADRDPQEFLATVKRISQEQAEKGA